MLKHYKTRPFVTLLWFAGIAGIFGFGVFHALYLHHASGWYVMATAALVFSNFSKRYARKTN